MTTREWNEAMDYLENGEIGNYAENEGRTVEVVSMCGGRYLCCDNQGVCELTFEVWRALEFLKNGRIFRYGKVFQH